MKKIKTSALIGLGALGILFGRKMPGVQVIADEDRIARYSAEPVVCNGEECKFSYVTPAEGRPVDLLLVAVKATVLEQAIQDIAKFVGPDTVILSVLNGITSEEHIDAAYPGHTLWSVAIGMDATRTGRTLVFNQAGKIQFGERSGEMTDRVQGRGRLSGRVRHCQRALRGYPLQTVEQADGERRPESGRSRLRPALRRPAPARRSTGHDARGHAGGHPAGEP